MLAISKLKYLSGILIMFISDFYWSNLLFYILNIDFIISLKRLLKRKIIAQFTLNHWIYQDFCLIIISVWVYFTNMSKTSRNKFFSKNTSILIILRTNILSQISIIHLLLFITIIKLRKHILFNEFFIKIFFFIVT